tara:strand:+ start:704 stop:1747 length:1044 start_codon:yes stop_codon:yes gene_type:complete
MIKVSVIIPVYNAEKYLHFALDSVTQQTFKDLEIICVNDGSTDGSAKILKEYQDQDKRIKILDQPNSGGSAARNTGIRHAKGQYVMFLDSDDLYTKDIVASAYRRAIETNADIVLYNFVRFVGKPSFLATVSKVSPGKDIDFFKKDDYAGRLFNDFATITWNKLVKRSVIVDNNISFDTGLSHNHDVDFSIRLMLAADSYSWLDKVGYYYRLNESGLTATKRDDPTNVLKILVSLNELFESEHTLLKQSFDNYVVDMIVGTLEKYNNDTVKQEEVFNFAHQTVVPSIGLDKKNLRYVYPGNSDLIKLVRAGDFDQYSVYANTLRQKIRRKARKAYNKAQALISRLAV